MVRWRSGLTHMPFTHALTGSNPVRATILKNNLVNELPHKNGTLIKKTGMKGMTI